MDGYDSRSRFILIIRLIDNAKVVGRESINLFDNRYFDVSCTFRSSSCCCIINRRIKYKVTFEVTAFGGKHSEKEIIFADILSTVLAPKGLMASQRL